MPSAILAAYYANPTLPAEYTIVPTAGACWIGLDGDIWVCPIFENGEFDIQEIGLFDAENADEDLVDTVRTYLGLLTV